MVGLIPLFVSLAESEQPSWDMLKLITETQFNLAVYGIIVLIAVAGLVTAITWSTGFWAIRRQLRDAIKSLKSEMAKGRQEDFAKHTERITAELKNMEIKIEKSTKIRMDRFDAEKARLFALVCAQLQTWEAVAHWLSTAIQGYAQLDEQKLVRGCVDLLIEALGKCKKLEDDRRKDIENCLPFIPEVLRKEKNEIKKKLSQLPKKKAKD